MSKYTEGIKQDANDEIVHVAIEFDIKRLYVTDVLDAIIKLAKQHRYHMSGFGVKSSGTGKWVSD